MTRRKPPPRVETLQIPEAGEVNAAVHKVFIDFQDENLGASAEALVHLADKYEALVFAAIKEYVAPPTPRNEVALQISAIGTAARDLVCALLAASAEVGESLKAAEKFVPNLPDHFWQAAGGVFLGDSRKHGPPSAEEIEIIVAKFADRARDAAVTGGVFFERPGTGGKTPTRGQLEYSALWLAVLADLAIPSGRTEPAERKTIHEIAKRAAIDFKAVTGTRANRSPNRDGFIVFLERIWIACKLDQLGAKSGAYVQAAVDSQSQNEVA